MDIKTDMVHKILMHGISVKLYAAAEPYLAKDDVADALKAMRAVIEAMETGGHEMKIQPTWEEAEAAWRKAQERQLPTILRRQAF